jgi:C1A family cysteine protease
MHHFCTAIAFLGLQSEHCNKKIVSSEVEQTFLEHMSNFGLSYGTKEEYKFRLDIFAKKDKENREINADPNNTFTVGHNQFSTYTDAEYKQLLGFRGVQPQNNVVELDTSNLADSVDWRTKGAVNPVKNQGQCGSCWTFSAIAAFEGHHFISTGKLESFAEQEIVDCDHTSYGCNGGW